MKKKSILILTAILCLSLFGLSACGNPTPIVVEGETTIINDAKGSPDKFSASENAFIVAGKLQSLSSYTSTSTGGVVAKKGFITYNQAINDSLWKNNDEILAQTLTDSTIVKVGKQTFVKNGKVALREATNVDTPTWNDTFSVATVQAFKGVYGVMPSDLTNYILNDKTILFSELVSNKDGIYTFRYSVDKEKATSKYQLKMKEYGDLSDYPSFKKCEFILKIDSKWNPIEVTVNDEYSVNYPVIGKVDCVSKITQTFANINSAVVIPDSVALNNAIQEEPTTPTPGPIEKDEAMEALTEAVTNLDLIKGIKLRGNIKTDGSEMSMPLDFYFSFDPNKLDVSLNNAFRFQFKTNLLGNEIQVSFIGDRFVYVMIGGAKYKFDIGTSTEKNFDFKEILSACSVSKTSENLYRVTLKPEVLAKLNEFFAKTGLGISFKSMFADITIVNARVAEINFVGCVDGVGASETLLTINTTVSEFPFDGNLPDKVTYLKVDQDVFSAKIKGIVQLVKKLQTFDIEKGIEIDAVVNFMLPIDIKFNIAFDKNAIAEGNALGSVIFNLTLDFVAKVDITYSNGKIYMITQMMGETSMKVITVTDSIANMILSANGAINLDFLINLFMSADCEVTDTAMHVKFDDAFVKTVQSFYDALISVLVDTDMSQMGDMAELVKYLLNTFKTFSIDEISFDINYDKTFDMKFSLNGTIVADNEIVPNEISLSLNGIRESKETFDFMSKTFAKKLDDFNATRELSVLIDYYANIDNIWFDSCDSYLKVLADLQKKYDVLPESQKAYLANATKLEDMKTEYLALVKQLKSFLDKYKTFVDSNLQTDFDAASKIYDTMSSQQISLLDSTIAEAYLEKRIEVDTARANALVVTIDGLLDIADVDELKSATDKAQADYDKLYIQVKNLVTNYPKIDEARVEYGRRIAEKIDNEMLNLTSELQDGLKLTETTALDALNKKARSVLDAYNKLNESEKALVANFQRFNAAERAFVESLNNIYDVAIKAISAAQSISDVVAGDDCYNKIVHARMVYKIFLSGQIKAEFVKYSSFLSTAESTHRKLEVNPIDALYKNLGDVSAIDFENKLNGARAEMNKLREAYLKSATMIVAPTEKAYIRMFISKAKAEIAEGIDATVSKKAANDAYAHAMSAYATTLQENLASVMKDIEAELAELNG